MKLFAIADLHLARPENRQALIDLPPHPEDWLIVVGDVCENIDLFEKAMALLTKKFAKLFWTPGNHDLWTISQQPEAARGLFRYNELVAICRRYGIHTPEDAYVRWPLSPEPLFIAPIFTLYDYSFRPPHVTLETAVSWAEETNVVCNDEFLLH
ncbi:MAG: metallophosphoesterase, partial [Anaerolineae bacterium]|nr:metallophosphoesterase [Anaerolineae bacterium]